MRLRDEARAFCSRQKAASAWASQLATMQLVCGVDLSAAFDAGDDLKDGLIRRVERAIERERLKGMRRHWSYDLNRHIALKQVLDRLRGATPDEALPGRRKQKRRRKAP